MFSFTKSEAQDFLSGLVLNVFFITVMLYAKVAEYFRIVAAFALLSWYCYSTMRLVNLLHSKQLKIYELIDEIRRR